MASLLLASNPLLYYVLVRDEGDATPTIHLTLDGGVTWIDKTGNYQDIVATLSTSNYYPLRSAVVPVWVPE